MDSHPFDRMCELTAALQDDICSAIEELEAPGAFEELEWERPGGGGGRARIIQGGDIIEKGGVNVSAVHGELPPALRDVLPGDAESFRAAGISLVLHPRNPKAPTVHANFRRVERGGAAWYGGGADLTPHYLFDEDARHFHAVWKAVCDRHAGADYAAWKQACDDYFYIAHRREHRGIGGIFFDHLAVDVHGGSDLVEDAGRAFVEAYVPILRRRAGAPWTEPERTWQLVRRGRYVEFNLVYDRGTAFGLHTGGSPEAVLMPLPDPVRWIIGHEPAPDSWEARTLDVLRNPRRWA